MKKILKKAVAFLLVLSMIFTVELLAPQRAEEVQAASKVYINPYSAKTVTYKPGNTSQSYFTTISIVGCEKQSEIKKLESSSKYVKVEPRDGYICAYFTDKACKATITCKVKGVNLKTTLTVKKYTNPCKSIKVGGTNLTSKYNKTTYYYHTKAIKKKQLAITMNKGWKITSVSVYNKGNTTRYSVNNATKFNKKISLTSTSSYVMVHCKNDKTGVTETLSLYINK